MSFRTNFLKNVLKNNRSTFKMSENKKEYILEDQNEFHLDIFTNAFEVIILNARLEFQLFKFLI